MNKLLGFILISCVLISCGKDNTFSNDFSSAAFINAAPATAASIPSLNVYIDTFLQTSVAYGGTTGYLSLNPGTRKLQLKNSANLVTYVDLGSEGFSTNTASTYVVYDTISVANPTLRVMRLSDTLTLPPAGFIKVRFLHLAPRTGPLDVTFVRTTVVPNDSITFSNLTYAGATPNVQALSTFTSIPLGAYTIKLKNAGTQTVIGTSTTIASLANLAGAAGLTGINTIYLTGGAAGAGLAFSRMRHYP
jgi:hypothetical protein